MIRHDRAEEITLEGLVAELDSYLPADLKNQHVRYSMSEPTMSAPTGPGTLSGFHAKIAEVFRLGQSAGWDKAVNTVIALGGLSDGDTPL